MASPLHFLEWEPPPSRRDLEELDGLQLLSAVERPSLPSVQQSSAQSSRHAWEQRSTSVGTSLATRGAADVRSLRSRDDHGLRSTRPPRGYFGVHMHPIR